MPMADVCLFGPQSYFRRDNKHRKMSVDTISVGIYVLGVTPNLLITDHRANILPMLFYDICHHSTSVTVHAKLSYNIMCTDIHDEINQNLMEYQKELLISHQRYGNENIQWCQSFMRYHKYKTGRGNSITKTPVIDSNNPDSCNFNTPLCMDFYMGKMKNSCVNYWTFNHITEQKNPSSTTILSQVQ